jgi:hypothetical protein
MVQFLIGCFVGAVVAFAAVSFMVAAEDEEDAVHNKRKGTD